MYQSPVKLRNYQRSSKKLKREAVDLAASFLTLDEALDIGLTPEDINVIGSGELIDLTSGVLHSLIAAHDLLENDQKILNALRAIVSKRQDWGQPLEFCLKIGPVLGSLSKTLSVVSQLHFEEYTEQQIKIALGVSPPQNYFDSSDVAH